MTNHIHDDPLACKAWGCAQRADAIGDNDDLMACFYVEHDPTAADCLCYTCEMERNPLRYCRNADGSLPRDAAARHFTPTVLRLPAIQSMIHRISGTQGHPLVLLNSLMLFEDVYVRIPGVSGSLFTFVLPYGSTLARSYAQSMEWEPSLARDFYADLHGAHAIDDALFEALMRDVPHSLDKRRSLTAAERAAIWQKTSGKCSYCGCELTLRRGLANSMHADHFFPKSKGGACDPLNFMPACPRCNLSKGNKFAAQFQSLGGYDD